MAAAPQDTAYRFQVQITAAYPELLADLATVPTRARAERLRCLATIGLAMQGRGVILTDQNARDSSMTPAPDPLLARRLRILDALDSGD